MTAVREVVPRLTRWGLTPDADLIYRALSTLGTQSVNDLARQLGIPQQRVNRALDELVAAEAVRPGRARTTTAYRTETAPWEPVALASVLPRLRRPRDADPPAERWRRHVATVSGLGLPALENIAVRRWPTRAITRRRVAELVAAERYEHLTINTEPVIDAESTAAALPLDRSILARGIRLRMLGLPPSDGDRWYGVALGGTEGMYRERQALPLKLLLFDRRVALFPADPLDLEKGYVEVRDPTVAQALGAMFDRLWAEARDPCLQGVRPIELTARELALVRLLAMGHTDQSAAVELKVSVRTVAYTMRNLMDRLGVDNRFQLALLLGATGRAPLPPTAREASGESTS
ncbi:LuxR C-terminal-related transcriptional regulator [Actinomycetes bacterium KLBMP 9797]